MKKIFFVFATPPLQTYFKRYSMDYLEKNSCEVHVLDLSYILNPIAFNKVKEGLIKEKKREIFYSKREYKKYVKETGENAIFILTMDFYLDTYFIHKALSKKQKYGYLSRMDTNVEISNEIKKDRIKEFFRKFSIHRLLNSLFIRVPKKVLRIKVANFVILGGLANKEDYLNLCLIGKDTIIKHIHSLDYDRYLEIKNMSERIIEEPYCVFLDEFLPYHPDILSTGIKIDAKSYYKELDTFFSNIEKIYNIKVVIAAHPRSNYEKYDDLKKYKVIKFKTAELVKESLFVIAHRSTSISYAVIFKKPIILIQNEAINNIFTIKKSIEKISSLLKLPIYNLPLNINYKKIEMNINIEFYNKYINNYLKPLKEINKSKLFKEEFFDIINNL